MQKDAWSNGSNPSKLAGGWANNKSATPSFIFHSATIATIRDLPSATRGTRHGMLLRAVKVCGGVASPKAQRQLWLRTAAAGTATTTTTIAGRCMGCKMRAGEPQLTFPNRKLLERPSAQAGWGRWGNGWRTVSYSLATPVCCLVNFQAPHAGKNVEII